MPGESAASTQTSNKLGYHLATIRNERGYSLRQVEELTNKLVSNAYLSQIETGKISQPSPNILHALATLYKASYENMMELAGYIIASRTDNAMHGRAATFAELNLTEAEEHEMIEYIKFKRSLPKDDSGEAR